MIEPGAISTNIVKNIKTAKDFDPNKSPYAKMVQQVFQGFESIAAAYSSHPSKVAQTILSIINSPNLELRNPVGKDAAMTLESRKICQTRNFMTRSRNRLSGQYYLVSYQHRLPKSSLDVHDDMGHIIIVAAVVPIR